MDRLSYPSMQFQVHIMTPTYNDVQSKCPAFTFHPTFGCWDCNCDWSAAKCPGKCLVFACSSYDLCSSDCILCCVIVFVCFWSNLTIISDVKKKKRKRKRKRKIRLHFIGYNAPVTMIWGTFHDFYHIVTNLQFSLLFKTLISCF